MDKIEIQVVSRESELLFKYHASHVPRIGDTICHLSTPVMGKACYLGVLSVCWDLNEYSSGLRRVTLVVTSAVEP